jgi:mannose-6-phosphate isomerase-like protein (cupin superfamily)
VERLANRLRMPFKSPRPGRSFITQDISPMGAISSTTPADKVLAGFRAVLDQLEHPVVGSFAAEIDWDMAQRDLTAASLPCLVHLPRATTSATGAGAPLACLLAENSRSLSWGQTYNASDFGRHFMENYGWTEIFGTRGHFANSQVAGGFLLLGPNVTYPDHHHEAEEIYVPLTGGALWKMGRENFSSRDAGEVIHHRSNVSHAMRTTEAPLLALYLWRGGPLAQRSVLGASSGEGN